MKKLPIGIQTFSKIREDDYIYIDKTAIAQQLIEKYQYAFLSRPRRFGKSLFLDTLQNIFVAKRELFEGLTIEKTYDWSQNYPVIRLDLSGDFSTIEKTSLLIKSLLDRNQKRLGLSSCENLNLSVYFQNLIIAAYEKYQQPVVILIDEYDKPILDNIGNSENTVAQRNLLQSFYVAIKACDQYLRFVFLTGVSKFSKVSIFSGLNNLMDVSLHADFATICGYTHHDLETDFAEHLQGVDWAKLREWYNGYQFNGEAVYNPFDILKFIANGKVYDNYWFETGTPTFLIKQLQKQQYFLPDLENLHVGSDLVNSFDIENVSVESLLFQAGYLTIANIEQSPMGGLSYRLHLPNKEVRMALAEQLLRIMTQPAKLLETRNALYLALQDGDMAQVEQTLKQIFASIPYHLYSNTPLAHYEGYYSVVIYSYLLSLGVDIHLEGNTNKGRLDMVIDIADKRYLIEFKVDGRGDALQQIKDNQYFQAFYDSTLHIYLLGIHFSEEERNVTVFEWERD